MKFGKHLEDKNVEEWRPFYVDYKELKALIKEASVEAETTGQVAFSPRMTSLTVQKAPAGKEAAQERFFQLLEQELDKVGKFTGRVVDELRDRMKALHVRVDRGGANMSEEVKNTLEEEARDVGADFLKLEKYVNLNYMGFHKILKKHDKMMPHAPCRQFYIAHLHQQPWVQGQYSDLLVSLSNIYSKLRGDPSGQKNEDAAQGFVRSTTKYWVRTDDVSAVKHHVLQHLPVFQFEKDNFAGDAQLINSVYFDNSQMELYHGRLDKKPGAIALRIRWYGPGTPTTVYVERKTHREGWKGEESVKERFELTDDRVMAFLDGGYKVDDAIREAQARGKLKKEADVEGFRRLFVEIQDTVEAKQLCPLVRTQYMRTAFQIPFDATVRVSLDTNLTMIKENPDDGPSCRLTGRWYRDPTLPISRTEITRFPHAVLEVKLSLPEGEAPPAWVMELLESGYLTEVHKFSKFIHGCCTLMPDTVQAVPYWVDDESVRQSMLASASDKMDEAEPAPERQAPAKPRKRHLGNDEVTHPLLGDEATLKLMPDRDQIQGLNRGARGGLGGGMDDASRWLNKMFSSLVRRRHGNLRTSPMRIEPKTFFANERTFLAWLHMAVTIGSIAAALLGFAGASSDGSAAPFRSVEVIALIMLPVALLICGYALFTFLWRSRLIAKKQVGHFDDRVGPMGLAVSVVLANTAILILGGVELFQDLKSGQAK